MTRQEFIALVAVLLLAALLRVKMHSEPETVKKAFEIICQPGGKFYFVSNYGDDNNSGLSCDEAVLTHHKAYELCEAGCLERKAFFQLV